MLAMAQNVCPVIGTTMEQLTSVVRMRVLHSGDHCGINAGVRSAHARSNSISPIAGGASLFDIALRTEIGGAVEAMHGRILSPRLGYPNEDGSLKLVQMVNLNGIW